MIDESDIEDIEQPETGDAGGAGGFRVVLASGGVKIFLAKGEGPDQAETMFSAEAGRQGATVYEVPGYASLCGLLTHTEPLDRIEEVRFCAQGRGYVRYVRKPGGPALPPEEAIRKVMERPPLVVPEWSPGAGTAVTIVQTKEHPDPVVSVGPSTQTQPKATKAAKVDTAPQLPAVDRFIAAYLRVGGTLDGLADHLERFAER